MAFGGSGHAHTSNSCPTHSASVGDLRHHAVRLMKRRGRHGLRRRWPRRPEVPTERSHNADLMRWRFTFCSVKSTGASVSWPTFCASVSVWVGGRAYSLTQSTSLFAKILGVRFSASERGRQSPLSTGAANLSVPVSFDIWTNGMGCGRTAGRGQANAPPSAPEGKACFFARIAPAIRGRLSGLLREHPLQGLDLVGEHLVGIAQVLDLADRVQHGGVIGLPNRRPISGNERSVSVLARYIAIWRGRTTLAVRRDDNMSERLTL